MYIGQIGNANVRVCGSVKMTDLLNHLLNEKPDYVAEYNNMG
jgi:aminoglycoside 3-N-acetyltransferase